MGRQFSPGILGTIVIAIITALSGCARKGDNQMRSLTLRLPEPSTRSVTRAVGSKSVALPVEYTHIVINVHAGPGGGGLLATRVFDAHNGPIPQQVTIEIPNGNNRLVQVLVVGEVPGQAGMKFLYDDEIINLTGGTKSVYLLPVQVGSGGSQGALAGRILTGSNQGPTGPLNIYIQPPGGVPKMQIETGYAFGGYFSSFYVQGAGFQYFMPENNVAPFGPGSFNIDTWSTDTPAWRVVTQHPDLYEPRPWDDPKYEVTPAGKSLLGYFAIATDGSTLGESGLVNGRTMVYQSSGGSLTNSSGMAIGTGFDPVGNYVTGSVYWVSSPSGSTQAGRVSGGVTSPAGQELDDYLYITAARYGAGRAGQGSGALGFTGPYAYFSIGADTTTYMSPEPVQKKVSGGNLKFEVKYLPGVMNDSNAINSSVLLYKQMASSSGDHLEGYYGQGEGLDCAAMMQDGFISVPMIPVAGNSNAVGTVDVNDTISCANSGMIAAAVCPARGAQVLNFGVTSHSSYCVADPLYSAVPSMDGGVGLFACAPVNVALKDITGFEYTPPNWQGTTLSVNGGAGSFYMEQNCNSVPISSTTTMYFNGKPEGILFWKPNATGPTTIGLTPTPGIYSSTSLTVASTLAPDGMSFVNRNNPLTASAWTVAEHECIEVMAVANASGAVNNVGGDVVITPSASGAAAPNMTFYADGTCTVPSAVSTLTAGRSIGTTYMKTSGISSVTSGVISATSSPSLTVTPKSISIKPAPIATYAMFEYGTQGPPWNSGNVCLSANYTLYSSDSTGSYRSEAGASYDVVVTSPSEDVILYSGLSSCLATGNSLGMISTSVATTLSVAAGSNGLTLFARPSNISGTNRTIQFNFTPLALPSLSAMGWPMYN